MNCQLSQKSEFRQPMVYLSHSSYGMPGLAPLMNVLFWGRRDFSLSSSDRDMLWNVWNRPSESFMVDMGISSNIMKSPYPKCYMTFWDMTIYNDTLNWSDITPICEIITELDFITDLTLLPNFGGFHRTLKRVRLANRGRLLLRTPGPVPLGTCIMLRPFFPELVMSTDLLSLEHPSVLLFCFRQTTSWSV